jgi:2-dehydro-3-deoxygalactonokinase
MTQATPSTSPTGLIALDWGTTSLRAYRFDADGRVADRRALPWGIMNLPPAEDGADTSAASSHAGFRRALQAACGDWLRDFPVNTADRRRHGRQQTRLARSQLSSTCRSPSAKSASSMTVVDTRFRRAAAHRAGTAATRGAAQRDPRRRDSGRRHRSTNCRSTTILIGLPGTHSKWVHVRGKRSSTHFDTFMTGEMYAALSQHTILGRTMERDGAVDATDDAAFVRGCAGGEVARRPRRHAVQHLQQPYAGPGRRTVGARSGALPFRPADRPRNRRAAGDARDGMQQRAHRPSSATTRCARVTVTALALYELTHVDIAAASHRARLVEDGGTSRPV